MTIIEWKCLRCKEQGTINYPALDRIAWSMIRKDHRTVNPACGSEFQLDAKVKEQVVPVFP